MRRLALLAPALENDPQLAERFFSRLRFMFYAAAALPEALAERLRELGLATEEANACLVELRVAERGADRGDCLLLVRLPVHGGDTIQGSSFESRVRVEKPRSGPKALAHAAARAPGPHKRRDRERGHS